MVGTNIHERFTTPGPMGLPFPKINALFTSFGTARQSHPRYPVLAKDGTTLGFDSSTHPSAGKIHGAVITLPIFPGKAVQEIQPPGHQSAPDLDSSGEVSSAWIGRQGEFYKQVLAPFWAMGKRNCTGGDSPADPPHRCHGDAPGQDRVSHLQVPCPWSESKNRAGCVLAQGWISLPVQLSADPIFEDGEIRGSVLIFTDLSKFLDAEEAAGG